MNFEDILRKTSYIKLGKFTGTGFFLDWGKERFLITAKHLAQHDLSDSYVFYRDVWLPLSGNLKLIGHCKNDIDISVLQPDIDMADLQLPQCAVENNLKFTDEVMFFGYPLGLATSYSKSDRPISLVKRGIVSGFFGADLSSGRESFWIDAVNVPGFSGGPVVCVRDGGYAIAGVVSGRYREDIKVYDIRSKEKSDLEEEDVIGFTHQNAGIVLAHNIQHAIDVIESAA